MFHLLIIHHMIHIIRKVAKITHCVQECGYERHGDERHDAACDLREECVEELLHVHVGRDAELMRPRDLGVGGVERGGEDGHVEEDAEPLGVADHVHAEQVEKYHGPLAILGMREELKW